MPEIIEFKDNYCRASANVNLNKLITICMKHNLKGLQKLVGIPGTLGGALANNSGAYNTTIYHYIDYISVIDGKGEIKKIKKDDILLGYRYTNIKGKFFILDAVFNFSKIKNDTEKEQIKNEIKLIAQNRKIKQPLKYPNAGSFFKNPEKNFAGYLIEEAGLKGKKIGNAMVSIMHGNFIVNLGNAKANEIYSLAELCRKEVMKIFNINLEYEVEFEGEFEIIATK